MSRLSSRFPILSKGCEKYLTDPRDTATPAGMVDLLAKLQSHQLSKGSTALLLKIMTDSPTGQQRLKAGLQGWSIARRLRSRGGWNRHSNE